MDQPRNEAFLEPSVDRDDARPVSFGAFWPIYLSAHRRPGNRALHVVGTLSSVALLLGAAVFGEPWLILAAPAVGYAFAWTGHFVMEGNRPATFGHPFWSLAADVRMTGLILAGRAPPADGALKR